MFCGLFLAPGAVIVIVPLYVPGFNPAGFTDTVKLAGMLLPDGLTASQLPEAVVTVNATALEELTDSA